MESAANLPITTSTPDSDHTTHKTNKSFDVVKELSYIDEDGKDLFESEVDTSDGKDLLKSEADTSDGKDLFQPEVDTSDEKDLHVPESEADTSDIQVAPISEIDDEPIVYYYDDDKKLTDEEAILMSELEKELKPIILRETTKTKIKQAIETNNENKTGCVSQDSSYEEKDYDKGNDSLTQKMSELNLSAIDDSIRETELKEFINTHIEVILNMITDPIPEKKYNRQNDAFGRTCAYAFEVLITAEKWIIRENTRSVAKQMIKVLTLKSIKTIQWMKCAKLKWVKVTFKVEKETQ